MKRDAIPKAPSAKVSKSKPHPKMTINTPIKSLDKPQIIPYLSHQLDFTAFECKWVPNTAKIVVLGQQPRGSGALRVLEMNDGKLDLVSQDERAQAIKCGTFGASNKELAIGTFEGQLLVVDLERIHESTYTAQAHEGIINCVDGIGRSGLQTGPPEIATAGRDGFVRVWDTRKKDGCVAEIGPAEGSVARDCWTVAFGNSLSADDRCLVAGYDNGDLKMFDMRNMSLKWETNTGNGVCSIEFDRKDIKMNKMVVGGLEAAFHVFDLRTFHQDRGYAANMQRTEGNSTVWQIKHLPQNRDVFMATTGIGSVNLYRYNYPEKRVGKDKEGKEYGIMGETELLNHASFGEQPVNSFDWNTEKMGLCAFTSFDQTVKVGIVTKLNLL